MKFEISVLLGSLKFKKNLLKFQISKFEKLTKNVADFETRNHIVQKFRLWKSVRYDDIENCLQILVHSS